MGQPTSVFRGLRVFCAPSSDTAMRDRHGILISFGGRPVHTLARVNMRGMTSCQRSEPVFESHGEFSCVFTSNQREGVKPSLFEGVRLLSSEQVTRGLPILGLVIKVPRSAKAQKSE